MLFEDIIQEPYFWGELDDEETREILSNCKKDRSYLIRFKMDSQELNVFLTGYSKRDNTLFELKFIPSLKKKENNTIAAKHLFWHPCNRNQPLDLKTFAMINLTRNCQDWKEYIDIKPLSVTMQTGEAGHEDQNSSAHVTSVTGLQIDAVVVTERRLRIPRTEHMRLYKYVDFKFRMEERNSLKVSHNIIKFDQVQHNLNFFTVSRMLG